MVQAVCDSLVALYPGDLNCPMSLDDLAHLGESWGRQRERALTWLGSHTKTFSSQTTQLFAAALLRDPHEETQIAAAKAMGRIPKPDQSDLDVLVGMIEHEPLTRVQDAVVESLASLSRKVSAESRDAMAESLKASLKTKQVIDSGVVRAIAALGGKTSAARQALSEILANSEHLYSEDARFEVLKVMRGDTSRFPELKPRRRSSPTRRAQAQ